MYTSKIKSKTQDAVSRLWTIVTEFSDGTDTFTESITPQDRVGYEYWRDSRLKSLNGLTTLVTENNIGVVYQLPVAAPTQAELDKAAWFAKYSELEQLEKIQAKNFLTGARLTALTNKITAVKSFLDTNVKVEYLNFV